MCVCVRNVCVCVCGCVFPYFVCMYVCMPVMLTGFLSIVCVCIYVCVCVCVYVQPSLPVAQLNGHNECVDALAWAPRSSCHICTGGDDCRALIWELSALPKPITGKCASLVYYIIICMFVLKYC